jgi:hypothetical protein
MMLTPVYHHTPYFRFHRTFGFYPTGHGLLMTHWLAEARAAFCKHEAPQSHRDIGVLHYPGAEPFNPLYPRCGVVSVDFLESWTIELDVIGFNINSSVSPFSLEWLGSVLFY